MNLLAALRNTVTLDPFDVCYSLSSEAMNYLALRGASLPRRGIRYGAIRFLHMLLGRIRYDIRTYRDPIKENSLLFFSSTKNQRDALAPLIERIPAMQRTAISDKDLPRGIVRLLALPFVGVLLARYVSSTGYRRASMQYVFHRYWQSYGCYLYFRLLTREGVSAVILANDHWMTHRALLKAANDNGVPTVYVQHASVTTKFPPLEFSYALLDGRDALEKYDAIGPSHTQVYLVGTGKLDKYMQSAERAQGTRRIGICTNLLDPEGRVEELCAALAEIFGGEALVLRPHPRDGRRAAWMQMASRFGMGLSDSSSQSPLDFLRTVDVLVAGESNILLEAALLNVRPLYYDFPLEGRDHYGFLEHGLVQSRYTEPVELCAALQMQGRDVAPPRERTKRYCATVGTAYEGRSAELSYELLAGLLREQKAPSGKWKRIPDTVNLEAYELA